MGEGRAEGRPKSMDFTARRPMATGEAVCHFWQSLNHSFCKKGGGDGGGDGEGGGEEEREEGGG